MLVIQWGSVKEITPVTTFVNVINEWKWDAGRQTLHIFQNPITSRVPHVAITTFTHSPLPTDIRHGRSERLFLNPNTKSSFPGAVIQPPTHLLLCRPRRGCSPSAAPAPSCPPRWRRVWLVSYWPRRGWSWTAGSAAPLQSAWPVHEPPGCHLYPWDKNR